MIQNILLKGTTHRGDGLILPWGRLKARKETDKALEFHTAELTSRRCQVYCLLCLSALRRALQNGENSGSGLN